LAKLKVTKTHNETYTCRNILAKQTTKQSTNGERLNQTHSSCCGEKKTTNIQCYIYMGQKT
jgi:hypothetical protein